jgi:hypothetical protein
MLDFLNTIPDMTNTPEITMQEPKIPMTKRIRAYKAANPNATAKQIADATGATAVYVYQVLSDSSKNEKKAKPVAKNTPAISIKEHEELKARLANSVEVNIGLEDEIVGLKAVIKYLEEKIEEIFSF